MTKMDKQTSCCQTKRLSLKTENWQSRWVHYSMGRSHSWLQVCHTHTVVEHFKSFLQVASRKERSSEKLQSKKIKWGAFRSADLVWVRTMEQVKWWMATCWVLKVKVARNEVENASFAQRSAHRDSRIWRPELIEPAAEHKRRARGRRPTFKSAFPGPQILPQCNISSNYPL